MLCFFHESRHQVTHLGIGEKYRDMVVVVVVVVVGVRELIDRLGELVSHGGVNLPFDDEMAQSFGTTEQSKGIDHRADQVVE